jgi:DNA-binding CsgD family transcriptional regulator
MKIEPEIIGGLSFSPKEAQILRLVSEGMKNKEVGNVLGTTEHVVKNYLRSVYDKTGQSSRTELALWYVYQTEIKEKEHEQQASVVGSAVAGSDGGPVDTVSASAGAATQGATVKSSGDIGARPIGGADMYSAHHRREAR